MEKQNKNRVLLYWVVGIIAFLISHFAYIFQKEYHSTANYNIMFFGIIILSVVGLTFGCSILEKKMPFSVNKTFLLIATIGLIIAIVVFILMNYQNEMGFYASFILEWSFLRERLNKRIFIAIVLITSCIIYYFCKKIRIDKNKRFLISSIIALLSGSLFFSYSVFVSDASMSMGHMHAYTNSIINASQGVPYSEVNVSIYGHYGIMYSPLVKLFGNNYTAIAFSIALLAVMAFMLIFYILDRVIESTSLFFVMVVAIGGISTTFFGEMDYFQGFPHRVLFSYIAIACIVMFQRIKSVKDCTRFIILFTIGAFSVVWNLETGICVVLTISAYYICTKSEDLIQRIIKGCIYAICEVVFAYIIVNVYNLINGGNWESFKLFIYPIGSSYNISILTSPLPDIFGPHVFYILIYGIIIGISAYHILTSQNHVADYKSKEVVILSIALNGLLLMVYYINRTAVANLFISRAQMMLLLASGADILFIGNDVNLGDNLLKRLLDNSERLLKIGLGGVSLLLICVFFIEGIYAVPGVIERRKEKEWNEAVFQESLNTFVNEVPEDTLIFGTGAPEICFQLGRDPRIALMDFSDIEVNKEAMKYLDSVVSESDSFVVMYEDLRRGRWSIPDSFEVKQIIDTPCFIAMYCERIVDNG